MVCLQEVASANLLAAVDESEDALAFISEVISTPTDDRDFLEGTILIPFGLLISNSGSDVEQMARAQNYFFFAKIEKYKILLQFRGGMHPESYTNSFDVRFVGGGTRNELQNYEWTSAILPSRVLVPSSWLLEASIGETILVRTEIIGEMTLSPASPEDGKQEVSRVAGKVESSCLSPSSKYTYCDLDKNPYVTRDKSDPQTRADGLLIINRMANVDRKQHLFIRDMGYSGEKILDLLKIEYSEKNKENSRFKEAKLWLHIRDLICMTNDRMRERVFRLEFSHTRPSELSIMHLQSEITDSKAFRKGCSMSRKDVICRCLEKLEVILQCAYSEEYANITSDLRDRIEGQGLSSTRNDFISNQNVWVETSALGNFETSEASERL